MSVQGLKASTGITPPAKPQNFVQALESFKPQIALALPKHLNADRMVRIATTEFRKNPALAECNLTSIYAAIIIASQLGLEPGVLGQGYLIPYKGECQFVPGWQGYAELVARAGRASVWTGVIRKGDTFKYEMGASPDLKHYQNPDGDDDANAEFYYAIGRIKGAEYPVIEMWSHARVERHLKRYNKVGDRHYATKNSHQFEMYARKVLLLQVIKYLPKSVELQTAATLEYQAQDGTQKLTIDSAVKGVVPELPEPEAKPKEPTPFDNPPAPGENKFRAMQKIVGLTDAEMADALTAANGDYVIAGNNLEREMDERAAAETR